VGSNDGEKTGPKSRAIDFILPQAYYVYCMSEAGPRDTDFNYYKYTSVHAEQCSKVSPSLHKNNRKLKSNPNQRIVRTKAIVK
jgi:hypothetical protein